MKKVLVLFLLCVLVGCSDLTGGGKLTITKYEDGKTATRGYLLGDQIKVGSWVYFDDSGKREKQGRYVEGQMHGEWTFWLPDGSESWTATYEHGEGPRNGMIVELHDNGQKKRDSTWKNGQREGVVTSWRENGKKEFDGTFKDGKREGVWTYWHDNGQKSEEGTYKSDEKDGAWTFWDKQGNVTKSEAYKNGESAK
jgi:antitoxin component YwqK of YwqJK toxin-antitoxin module